MSKTVHEVTLLELLPENLRSDPEIIAASQATDTEFRALAKAIANCLTIADIDHAGSEIVDQLAAEMRVDFYDQTLSLEKRRALVKNGYLYKYLKGTAYAVGQIVTDAFDASEVQEWFDYHGEPYYFKVVTEANLPDISTINDVVEAIDSVKNVRSWLESIEALKNADLKVYYGLAVQQTCYHTLVQSSTEV